MPEKKSKLLGNIASLGIVNMANYLFPIITVPIVSRALGPEKIGIINYATSFIAYFSLLVAYSFNFTGTRRLAKNPDNQVLTNKVFSEIFCTQVILFFVSFVLYFLCVQYFSPINKEKTIAWITFLSCGSSLFSQYWIFQAKQDLKKIAFLNLLPRLVGMVFVMLFIRKAGDYKIYAFMIQFIGFIISVVTFIISINKYKIRLFWPGFNAIKNILIEDRLIFFSGVITSLYTSTGIVILGKVMNETQVGYYTSAQRLVDITRSIIMIPLNQAIFPLTVKMFNENKQKTFELIKKLLPLILIATILFFTVVEILGPWGISLLYGKKFEPAIPLFSILNVGLFFVFYGYLFGGNIMLNVGLDNLFVRIQVFASILSLILTIFIVPKFGSKGTAWIWTLTEGFITYFQYWCIKKKYMSLLDFRKFSPAQIRNSVREIINIYSRSKK